MELPSLDLNLLVALQALLSERNVTRAGERIGLSQPATSAALARLRRHFNDELLERVGAQYQLTPLAAALLEQSDLALRHVADTFSARPLFDATESNREFSVIASDYALTVFGSHLARLLEERAPEVRIRFQPPDTELVDSAASSLRVYDALLMPPGFFNDMSGVPLFEDDWVVIGARGGVHDGGQLTVDTMRAARWVVTFDRPTQFTPPDKTMSLLGIDRRADIVAGNFAALPYLITGTSRLALVPRRMADNVAHHVDIVQLEAPMPIPPLAEHIWWHPIHGADPGHRWLVRLIVDAARAATSEPTIDNANVAHLN